MKTQQVVDYLKGIVIDGVHLAQSGHPGGAMSSMDFAYILFSEFLTFDPDDPEWAGRDRFILSAGHESMLIYSLLYAIGWLNIDDLKAFRQKGSRTPGHPEVDLTPGVECTTGPLGQGCAMSVGFAIAAQHLRATLDEELYGHKVWTLLGDGCLQEGVTLAAASLAGHQKLDNLVWYYDKNSQQISGPIGRATSDDEESIFRGFGWNVVSIDGHNHEEIRAVLKELRAVQKAPTLIVGRSIIANGAASLAGSHKTHGAPLPEEERAKTKEALGIPHGRDFYWPKGAQQSFESSFARLRQKRTRWQERLEHLREAELFERRYQTYFGEWDSQKCPPIGWEKPVATRVAFGRIIEEWAETLGHLFGGSADLEPSNMTQGFASRVGEFSAENRLGRNLAFGVREFPMSAITNGMALYGGLLPFDATFLAFSDYSRPALRLGAIQKARVIHEFTHDSFYLGEDGPTHQPVEHLMSLRSMPDMYVMRPADARETEVLFRTACTLRGPSSFALSRQSLPLLDVSEDQIQEAKRGAWILLEEVKSLELILFASGSEVSLALEVARVIGERFPFLHGKIRLVSFPCWELFSEQGEDYRNRLLRYDCEARVSIEAGSTLGWERFVGAKGLSIGMDRYGESGRAGDLAGAFGFTVESIVERVSTHYGLRG